MKNLVIYSLLFAGIIMFLSCDREEFKDVAPADYNYIGIVSQVAPATVPEGGQTGGTVEIPLFYDVSSNSDFQVTFSVSGTAELGRDFIISDAVSSTGNTFTISVPADTVATTLTVEAVPNFETSTVGNLSFTAQITGLPDNVFSQAPLKDLFSIEILDDDCDFIIDDFIGSASVNDLTSGSSNGIYSTEITLVSGQTYEIADYAGSFLGTGGGLSYQFTIDDSDPTNITIDVPTQTFGAFGRSWEITDLSSGELVNTCGRELTFSSNLRTTAPTPDEFNINWTIVYTLN